MANVMLATRQATTDVLSTVSATTGMITNGVRAVANLAEVAEAHSAHYRDRSLLELNLAQEELQIVARDRATIRIARARVEIDAELKADKELAAHFKQIQAARSQALEA